MKSLIYLIILLHVLACANDTAGPGDNSPGPVVKNFSISSTAFSNGGTIPKDYVCRNLGGSNLSPQLSWTDIPDSTVSLALIMDDVIVGGATFIHWQIYNMPPTITELGTGIDLSTINGVIAGTNWNGSDNFYLGPCPPRFPTGVVHFYRFTLYAMKSVLTTVDSQTQMNRAQFEAAHASEIIDMVTLLGEYAN